MLYQIVGLDIKIVKDYETESKSIRELYNRFKSEYKIPKNLLKEIEKDERLNYYMAEEEKKEYINMWGKKEGKECESYKKEEYNLYNDISLENQKMCEVQCNHYLDVGCMCEGCSKKRLSILEKVTKGEHIEPGHKIIHKDNSNKNVIYVERIKIKVENKPKNILRKALINSLSNN
jgi:hypothetical protein